MHSAMDLDQKRKRFLFSLLTMIVMVAFPILLFINFMEGDHREMIIDLVVIAIMFGSFIALKKFNIDNIIYRASLFLSALNFFYTVSIGAGEGSVLYWVFAIPPLFFYFFGKKEGCLWSLLFVAGLCAVMLIPSVFNGHIYSDMTILRFLITLFFIGFIAFGLEASRDTFSKLLDENNRLLLDEKRNLEQALTEIKTLRGFIGICSNCKKIRNDEGSWEQIEIYVQNHSEANFSHGICPDCARQLYPELKTARNR